MQILFADQLGSHFTLDGESQVILEVQSQFRKRAYHRQKAHLILSAIRHRAEIGAELVSVDSYRAYSPPKGSRVVAPTSRTMRALVEHWGVDSTAARGFACSEEDFAGWASSQKNRLLLEDFYRWQRQRLGLLIEDSADGLRPVGGRWNFDVDNRLPPPKTDVLPVEAPWWPVEDDIDEKVRWDLDRLEKDGVQFIGRDGPRLFAVTEQEANLAAEHFLNHRLPLFGPFEDAMMRGDWAMSHSLLSVPLNLGLIDPVSLAKSAQTAFENGSPIQSVEAFIRQLIGWRDYVWNLYWYFGDEYSRSNALGANNELPRAWKELDSSSIEAACVRHSVQGLSDRGWLHHIERLMILANQASQRGYLPMATNDWFIDAFVDGTPWVMPANVIGMGLYADGGRMSTKPYVAGGAYISRMSNHCGGCPFDPKVRIGENACPFTAGYWNYLATNSEIFSRNHRMFQAMSGLKRLSDLEELLAQEGVRSRF